MGSNKAVVWCIMFAATVFIVLFTQVRSCNVATEASERHADEVKAVEEAKASVARSHALEVCIAAKRPPLECREMIK